MEQDTVRGIGGWLLVYLVGSIPLLIFYSMGLSGWFLDYPLALMIALFVVLATPLLLILMGSPAAPRWNIVVWWAVVVLMSLRSISVFLSPIREEELPAVILALSAVVASALGWAIVWTKYFRGSARVQNTFS